MIALISENLFHLFFIVGLCLLIFVPLLLGVVIVLFADRKIWAAVQKRKGPNVVGPFGLFQSLADALKYMFKEIIIPASANKIIFIRAPIVESVAEDVNVLSKVDDQIVLCSNKTTLVASFHPELSSDLRIHELFLSMAI